MLLFVFPAVFFLLAFYTLLKVRETEKKFPPEGRRIKTGDIHLHAVVKGRGRPVVLLHGGFGSTRDFTMSVMDDLSRNYHCVAFDRPGHGYSGRPRRPLTLLDQVRYIHEAVRALNLEAPVLVGHSLGGAAALAYALEYPRETAGILLINGYVTPFEGPPDIIHRIPAIPVLGPLYLYMLVRPLGNCFKGAIGRKVFHPEPPVENFLEASTALAMRPSHFRANAEDIRLLNKTLGLMIPRYAELRCPVLMLAGDCDPVAPVERHACRIAAAVPHAELRMLRAAGHQPCFSRKAEVLRAIDDLRARIGQETGDC